MRQFLLAGTILFGSTAMMSQTDSLSSLIVVVEAYDTEMRIDSSFLFVIDSDRDGVLDLVTDNLNTLMEARMEGMIFTTISKWARTFLLNGNMYCVDEERRIYLVLQKE